MTEKSILITGCSSGIGYVSAKILQERGWRVIASARDASDVERLKGDGLHAVQLDLSSPDSIAMALDWTLKLTEGRLDALFNNGAFAVPGAVEDLSRTALAYQFDHGLLGWHELTTAVLPVMRRQGFGRIVNCSSVLGITAMRYRGAYVAMKFALEGLTDALRLELYGSGIQVSLIEPGPITTKFRENAYQQFKRWIDAEHSLHKLNYLKMIQRLESDKLALFTLPPEAVTKALIHALEAKRAKPRYYVTKATWLMAMAKRILPTTILDRFVRRVAEKENDHYEKN